MISVDIDPADTVAQVKHKIFLKEQIPPNQQQLIFSGLSLANDSVMSSYNIQRDSTIHLVIKINPEASTNKVHSGSHVRPDNPNLPQTHTHSRSTQINNLNTHRASPSLDHHYPPQPLDLHDHPRHHQSSELLVVNCSTVSGRNVSVNARNTDTIIDLKNTLAEQEGIVLRQQDISLYIGNLELDDTNTLSHYGITPTTNIRIHTIPKNVSTLFIKTLNGKTFILYPPENSTVSAIKAELAEKSGIPPLQQRLVYQGQDLPDQQTLAQCRVPTQCTLHVIQTNPPATSATKPSLPLLIKTFTGKTITIYASPGGTVRNVKETINAKEGCPIDEIVIMLGGNELEDDRVLDHYQIQQGSTLLVTFKAKEKLKLSIINAVNGEMMSLDNVNVSDSIGQIEHRLALQLSVPRYVVSLVYKGNILGKHHTVQQHDLKDDSMIHLYMLQPRELSVTVKTVAGTNCSVTVSSFETVAVMKSCIQDVLSVPSNEQVLLHKGVCLDDGAYVSDYITLNNSAVYLFLKRGLIRNIILKHPGNKVMQLQLPVDTTVTQLKNIIVANEHVPLNQIALCYKGIGLESFYTLGDYLVKDGAQLNVVTHSREVFAISVQPADDGHKLFTLQVEGEESVSVVKLRVASYLRIPVNRLSLAYCGAYLLDNCLIRECNLPTVCVVLAEGSKE